MRAFVTYGAGKVDTWGRLRQASSCDGSISPDEIERLENKRDEMLCYRIKRQTLQDNG